MTASMDLLIDNQVKMDVLPNAKRGNNKNKVGVCD